MEKGLATFSIWAAFSTTAIFKAHWGIQAGTLILAFLATGIIWFSEFTDKNFKK